MQDPENVFPPELLDQQIEQPDTRLPRGEARLIHDLQNMYDQEKSSAIERVWMRVAQQRNAASQQTEPLLLQERRQRPARSFPMQQKEIAPEQQKRSSRVLGLIAAALICAMLVGSIALVLRMAQHPASSSGAQPGVTPTPSATAPTGNEQGKVVSSWSVPPSLFLGRFRAFTWSPDSQRIAAETQLNVQIKDATTGGHTRTITSGGLTTAWSPNGHYLAIDNTIINPATGAVVRTLSAPYASTGTTNSSLLSATLPRSGGNAIYALAWSPDSSMLAGALSGSGNKVVVWKVSTGQIVYLFQNQIDDTQEALAWSPDGTYIASASYDGSIQVWKARSGQVIFHYASPRNPGAVAWAPAGLTLSFLSGDKTIQSWDVTTNKKLNSYSAPATNSLAWSPDGTEVAGSDGKSVIIWNASTGAPIYTFTQPQKHVYTLAWSPNGKYIVSDSESQVEPGTPFVVSTMYDHAIVWIA